MKVELKNIKYSKFMSEETHCFEANIYIDGKKVTYVSNRGHGGAHMFGDYKVEEQLNELAKQLPQHDFSDMYNDGQKHLVDRDAESLINDLIDGYLTKKDCANKIMFRVPNQTYEKGSWSLIKGKLTDVMREKIVAKYGSETKFLVDEAITHFNFTAPSEENKKKLKL